MPGGPCSCVPGKTVRWAGNQGRESGREEDRREDGRRAAGTGAGLAGGGWLEEAGSQSRPWESRARARQRSWERPSLARGEPRFPPASLRRPRHLLLLAFLPIAPASCFPPSPCPPRMSPSPAQTSPQKTPPRARRSASGEQPVSPVQNVVGPFVPHRRLPRRPQSDPRLLQAQAPL